MRGPVSLPILFFSFFLFFIYLNPDWHSALSTKTGTDLGPQGMEPWESLRRAIRIRRDWASSYHQHFLFTPPSHPLPSKWTWNITQTWTYDLFFLPSPPFKSILVLLLTTIARHHESFINVPWLATIFHLTKNKKNKNNNNQQQYIAITVSEEKTHYGNGEYTYPYTIPPAVFQKSILKINNKNLQLEFWAITGSPLGWSIWH